MPDRGTPSPASFDPDGGLDPHTGTRATGAAPRAGHAGDPAPEAGLRRARRTVEPALGLVDFLREIGAARPSPTA